MQIMRYKHKYLCFIYKKTLNKLLKLNINQHKPRKFHFSHTNDYFFLSASHSICFVHKGGRPFDDKVGIHYVLSLSPLTCENSLALSHERRVLSEKLIIKVRDNLCHGWLSLGGTAVRLGPSRWQGKITGQTFDFKERSTTMRPQ